MLEKWQKFTEFRALLRTLFLRDGLWRRVDAETGSRLSYELASAWVQVCDRWGEIYEAEREAYDAYREHLKKRNSLLVADAFRGALARCLNVYCNAVHEVYRVLESLNKKGEVRYGRIKRRHHSAKKKRARRIARSHKQGK